MFIKLVIVGKLNVGKFIFINCILGEEWVVVYDLFGIICDSVYIFMERDECEYILIDMVGVWKCKKINEVVEKFFIVKIL